MPKENQITKERITSKINEPHKFNVIFHNDDFTPMDFVTLILRHIFLKSEREAEDLMLKVHHEGKAIIGSYSYDIAMTKSADATNIARKNGFPLRITINRE
ncbi:MAG: ATP-dependent Clp protease adaptor ClpS [Muribaculaceae bacterium]|nr:ATP-dependent Clp protease adaptor ClpS [Muribaculaceae bacterium]